MKQFRISLSLMALVLAIAASAFTTLPAKKVTSGTTFFDYQSGSQMSAGNYLKRTVQPDPGEVCPEADVLCGIWANEDPNNLGHPLQSDINALRSVNDANNDGIFDGETADVDFKEQL